MSRRTAQASQAIAKAWENEHQLVSEGKGTRDWTREEQEDILATGKAHDANGKAFEGHHMQSVSNKPEYQGEPGNIQFLSREEHQAAHGGSYQNPTNGYYDYKTGITKPFEGEKYEPCTIIDLSDPVAFNHCEVPVSLEGDSVSKQEDKVKNDTTPKKAATADDNQQVISDRTIDERLQLERIRTITEIQRQVSHIDQHPKGRGKGRRKTVLGYLGRGIKTVGRGIIRAGKAVGNGIGKTFEFLYEHPEISGPLMGLLETAVQNKVSNDLNERYNSSSRSDTSDPSVDSEKVSADPVPDIDIIPDDDAEPTKRASPREHTVNDPGQHYWKGGERVWVPKKPYRRGGNRSESTNDDED